MTADTFTNTLGAIIMGTGNDNNSWGSNANSLVFQIFEDAIANVLTSAVAGGTLDLSGTPPPAAASQVRYAALIFSGVLGSDQDIVVPNLTKFWMVQNTTSGAHDLYMKTSAGARAIVPQNSGWQLVFCDGATGVTVMPFNSAQCNMPSGSVAAPSYAFFNALASGWYHAGTQDFRFAMGGADVLQLTGPSSAFGTTLNILGGSVQQSSVAIIPPGTEVAYCGLANFFGSGAPDGWILEYGQTISRTTYANLLTALRATFTASFTNGSATVTNGSPSGLGSYGLLGATLECATPGITSLTISTIGPTSFTMSGNATANSGGLVTVYAYPYGNGDGVTTFTLPDRRGRVIAGRDDMGGSSSGRILTQIPASNQLGGSGGNQSGTISQANLPNVSFTVSGSASISSVSVSGSVAIGAGQGSHSHAVTGGTTAGSSNAGASITAGGTQIPTNASTISISSATLPSMTGTCTATGTGSGTISGTAASGGSGTAISRCQPTGISNWIIKT